MKRMMLLILGNFLLFWFSQHWALPASIYPLIFCFTKLALPKFFKKQSSLPPPEPNFDLEALQSTCPDKSTFRDVHTFSCLKIPHLAISYISCISPSLTAFFSELALPAPQSTAEPVIWWLSDFNAWTLLPFLPLFTSTAFLPAQKGQ